jgi:predicted RNase H-like HicB family nuclease
MTYLVVIEPTATGFSAYSPDLPGCVATGATETDVEREMREAMAFHVEGLVLEGYPVPVPSTRSAYVDIDAA